MCITISAKEDDSNIFQEAREKRVDAVFVVGTNGYESLRKECNTREKKGKKMEQLNQCTGKKKKKNEK